MATVLITGDTIPLMLRRKTPQHKVSIRTVEPNVCIICKSTDVYYRIGYRDTDNPMELSAPIKIIVDNLFGYSCRTHVLEATKYILDQAGVLESVEPQGPADTIP